MSSFDDRDRDYVVVKQGGVNGLLIGGLIMFVLIIIGAFLFLPLNRSPQAVSDGSGEQITEMILSQLLAEKGKPADSSNTQDDNSALMSMLLNAIQGDQKGINTQDTGQTQGGEQQALPEELLGPNYAGDSSTLQVMFGVADKEELRKALDTYDSGSNVKKAGDVPMGIAHTAFVDVYGAQSTGPTVGEVLPLQGIPFIGYSLEKMLPQQIQGLQSTEVISGQGMIFAMYPMGPMVESIVDKIFYIPPGYTGDQRFYDPESARTWTAENTPADVKGTLQGTMGVETTLNVQMCVMAILDTQDVESSPLEMTAPRLLERAAKIWDTMESRGDPQYWDTLAARDEATKKARAALDDPQIRTKVVTAAEASWAPGGASYGLFVKRTIMLGYTVVDLNVNVTWMTQTCQEYLSDNIGK